jgi:hypothetical protein
MMFHSCNGGDQALQVAAPRPLRLHFRALRSLLFEERREKLPTQRLLGLRRFESVE